MAEQQNMASLLISIFAQTTAQHLPNHFQNGNPKSSLTTTAGYNPSNWQLNLDVPGRRADAVVLSRARGSGTFNCASIFMYDALAESSLAHAQ